MGDAPSVVAAGVPDLVMVWTTVTGVRVSFGLVALGVTTDVTTNVDVGVGVAVTVEVVAGVAEGAAVDGAADVGGGALLEGGSGAAEPDGEMVAGSLDGSDTGDDAGGCWEVTGKDSVLGADDAGETGADCEGADGCGLAEGAAVESSA